MGLHKYPLPNSVASTAMGIFPVSLASWQLLSKPVWYLQYVVSFFTASACSTQQSPLSSGHSHNLFREVWIPALGREGGGQFFQVSSFLGFPLSPGALLSIIPARPFSWKPKTTSSRNPFRLLMLLPLFSQVTLKIYLNLSNSPWLFLSYVLGVIIMGCFTPLRVWMRP